MSMAECSIPNCKEDYVGKGFCEFHYRRNKRYGDPLYLGRPRRCWSLEQKFNHYVGSKKDCWEWKGQIDPNGYSKLGSLYAHVISYELHVEKKKKGMDLDHLCRNRSCVNPKHLEQVTRRVNVLRGIGVTAINAKKTHCVRGHEFSKENTRIYYGTNRWCIACERIRDRKKLLKAKDNK